MILTLSAPGLLLCAVVPPLRAAVLVTTPEDALGLIVRWVAFLPLLLLTLAGWLAPIAWPFVTAMAIYRILTRELRGRDILIAVGGLLATTVGSYIWLIMLGEALHAHPLRMFPWDPPSVTFNSSAQDGGGVQA